MGIQFHMRFQEGVRLQQKRMLAYARRALGYTAGGRIVAVALLNRRRLNSPEFSVSF